MMLSTFLLAFVTLHSTGGVDMFQDSISTSIDLSKDEALEVAEAFVTGGP